MDRRVNRHRRDELRDNRGVQSDHRSLSGPWLVLAAVRFLAELGLIAALGYVGWRILDNQPAVALLLALVLAAAAATIWGAWVAPKSEHRLDDPGRLVVELALFGVTCAALVVVGNDVAAVALGLAYAVSAPVGRRGF